MEILNLRRLVQIPSPLQPLMPPQKDLYLCSACRGLRV